MLEKGGSTCIDILLDIEQQLTVANDPSIFCMSTVILPKVIMITLMNKVLISITVHLVQPDVALASTKPSPGECGCNSGHYIG